MVYILLAPGFEEAEALVPADLLRRAGIETKLVSLEGEAVTGSHRITVRADASLAEIDLSGAEMLVLPGGGEGVKNLGAEARVEELVREAAGRDLWIAAICAAPTLLARAGVLPKGARCVCYPGLEGELSQAGAVPRMDQSTVAEGRLITGRGPGSAFDFGLALAEALAGSDAAAQVRAGLQYAL